MKFKTYSKVKSLLHVLQTSHRKLNNNNLKNMIYFQKDSHVHLLFHFKMKLGAPGWLSQLGV